MNFAQRLVNFFIEGRTLGVILAQQFLWAQHFLFVLRELALVEVAAEVEELLGGEAARLLVARCCIDDFVAVVPPVANGLAMGREHGLGLREVLVALGHIEAVEPRVGGAEAFGGALCALVVEEEDVGGNRGVG